MKKVLITDAAHPLLVDGLTEMGFSVDYEPDITVQKVADLISQYQGLIINSRVPADRALLGRAAQLKFVCRLGSGLEVIDLDCASELGIAAFNSPEGNKVAVAEHALGLLLCLLNHIPKANAEVKQGKWTREANRGEELTGKTVGLIAYGNNARALAKVLQGFDVNILAYDKYLHDFGSGQVTPSSLERIFAEADILSLHLPLTSETKYMIDYEFLTSFKKKIWLVNTARGMVLKTADLLRCLEEGRIVGAALDVLENEKLTTLTDEQKEIFHRLAADDRVVLTPHVAGWTHQSKKKIAEVLLQKIKDLRWD